MVRRGSNQDPSDGHSVLCTLHVWNRKSLCFKNLFQFKPNRPRVSRCDIVASLKRGLASLGMCNLINHKADINVSRSRTEIAKVSQGGEGGGVVIFLQVKVLCLPYM